MYLQWAASAENIYLLLKEPRLVFRSAQLFFGIVGNPLHYVVSTSRKTFHKPYQQKSETKKVEFLVSNCKSSMNFTHHIQYLINRQVFIDPLDTSTHKFSSTERCQTIRADVVERKTFTVKSESFIEQGTVHFMCSGRSGLGYHSTRRTDSGFKSRAAII